MQSGTLSGARCWEVRIAPAAYVTSSGSTGGGALSAQLPGTFPARAAEPGGTRGAAQGCRAVYFSFAFGARVFVSWAGHVTFIPGSASGSHVAAPSPSAHSQVQVCVSHPGGQWMEEGCKINQPVPIKSGKLTVWQKCLFQLL